MTYSNKSIYITSKRSNRVYEFKVITKNSNTEIYSVDTCSVIMLFTNPVDENTIYSVLEASICMYEIGQEQAVKGIQNKLKDLLGF